MQSKKIEERQVDHAADGTPRDGEQASRRHVIVDGVSLGDTVFRPHGRYEARIVDGLLRSEVHGPMNSEMMAAYQINVLPLYAEAARAGRFAVMTLWNGSVMMSPETLEAYAEVLKDFVEKIPQLAGIAHVAGPQVEGGELMGQLLASRCFGPAKLPYRMFSESASAEIWLRELLGSRPGGSSENIPKQF